MTHNQLTVRLGKVPIAYFLKTFLLKDDLQERQE